MTRIEPFTDQSDPAEPETQAVGDTAWPESPSQTFSSTTPSQQPQPTAPAPVGAVVGTEDATPLVWHVAVAENQFLQLDDVVTTERTLPDGTRVSTCGVVTQVTGRHEGATFASDTFLIQGGACRPARRR